VLVFTRRRGEAIMIGDGIEIHVLRAGRDGVRLGVVAPASLPVHRHEVYQQICESNRAAATPDPADPERRAAIEAELNSRLP
jgi:carbon storage regulator